MIEPERIMSVLASLGKPSTAGDIANHLGVDRSSVNATLYKYIGSRFLKSEDSRPRWSILTKTPSRGNPVHLPQLRLDDFHIDQQGGDWQVSIIPQMCSRNDPAFVVEMVGIRRCRVLVNATLIENEDQPGKPAKSAVFAVAAAALAAQIAKTYPSLELFDFPKAFGEILLAFSSDVYRNRPIDPSK